MIAYLKAFFTRRIAFNRTYRELSRLTNRELDDLGISRNMIARIAYESAYERD